MNETMMKVVMIVLLSALFPLVGFYLDWRTNKKRLGADDAIKKAEESDETFKNKDLTEGVRAKSIHSER